MALQIRGDGNTITIDVSQFLTEVEEEEETLARPILYYHNLA
jgi:hypothetical protein